MMSGTHTALREILEEDLEALRVWRNNPDQRRYFREYRDITPSMQKGWYENTVCRDDRVRMFAIVEKASGRLLGACGLCYIDWLRHSADFSIYLGADDLYIDDTFAPDAARLLLRYGFEELNLHRVWAEIYDFDSAKRDFLPALGFKLEGRHRETHWSEGRWSDSLFYGLLDREYFG